jgi:ribonuclease R
LSKHKAPWRGMVQNAKVPEVAVILAAVRSVEPRPITHIELLRRFKLGPDQEKSFKKLMKALVRQGQLDRLKGKRYLIADPNRLKSVENDDSDETQESEDGVEGEESTALPSSVDNAENAADTATLPDPNAEGFEADSTSPGEGPSRDKRIRAQLIRQGHLTFALPVGDSKKPARGKGLRGQSDRILIPRKFVGKSKPGDLVMVQIVEPADRHHEAVGKVMSGFRREADFNEVSSAFFREHGLTKGYPRKALHEAEGFAEPAFDAASGREDLRGESIVTIDPITARDHDDAISLKRLANGHWQLGVHIADVAEYVAEDSFLDREALQRGFTQYLPWTAMPMLPSRLSTDLCSLREGVDRLAFSCFMDLSADGEMLRYRFGESMIRVAKFYSYEQAQELKDQGDAAMTLLDEFAKLRQALRKRDGNLEFNFPEPRIVTDDEGVPIDVQPGKRLDSYGWIEECMLVCNQAAAKYLTKNHLPGLFRVHEQPDLDVVAELFALQPPSQHDAALQAAFNALRETQGFLNPAVQQFYARLLSPEKGTLPASVQRRILMSMKKAMYAPQALGHFALGWQHYSHFTSPIRRYADLWIHRVMKAHLRGKKQFRDEKQRAVAIAEEISEREIRIMKTERKGMKTAIAWILQNHIGKEFTATITGVEEFGLFVAIQNPYGEGMVPVAKLGNDFFVKDDNTYSLVGKRTKQTFALGNTIEVRLVKSNPFSGQIDFEPVEKASAGANRDSDDAGATEDRAFSGRPAKAKPRQLKGVRGGGADAAAPKARKKKAASGPKPKRKKRP